MKSYELKDLDRLVSLTCQKDFPTLQKAFAEVCNELMVGIAFRVYLNQSMDESDPADFIIIGHSDHPIDESVEARDQYQLDQLAGLEPSSEAPTVESILIPALHGHRIYGAIVVDHGIEFYAELHANVVLSAITIFANQMALLQNSSQDALTGLFNRYMLDNTMKHILNIKQARRESDGQCTRWCLAMVDIDHFKSVNDTYGHLIGDEVLLKLAQLMKNSFRHEDLLFRFGGEEFSIMLKNVTLTQATSILERFRAKVSSYRFPQVGQVTISIGLTAMTPGQFPSTLLGNADKALYYSKEHGRNQLNCFEYLYEMELLEQMNPSDNDLELL